MNKKRDNQDHFNVMREIQKQSKTSQRDLAEQLGFSLGKFELLPQRSSAKRTFKNQEFSRKH